MFKVNFKNEDWAHINFFKIFKTKDQAEIFIKQLGDRFVSWKLI